MGTHRCEVFGRESGLDEGGVGLLRHQHELRGAARLLLAEGSHQQLRLLEDLLLAEARRGQLQFHDVQHLRIVLFCPPNLVFKTEPNLFKIQGVFLTGTPLKT